MTPGSGYRAPIDGFARSTWAGLVVVAATGMASASPSAVQTGGPLGGEPAGSSERVPEAGSYSCTVELEATKASVWPSGDQAGEVAPVRSSWSSPFWTSMIRSTGG